MTRELPLQFTGTGSMKKFEFNMISKTDKALLYAVDNHFEVFKRKTTPICLDFNLKIYSESDDKVMYPKDEDFGVWAWSVKTKERAMEIFDSINNDCNLGL